MQGPGAIDLLGDELSRFGNSALIVADPFVAETMKDKIMKAVDGKIEAKLEVFSTECCDHEIARLTANKGVDVVAGIGGGKTLDTCKAVSHTLKIPTAVVPTIASTDAPCSGLSVIYTRTGAFDRYLTHCPPTSGRSRPSLRIVATRRATWVSTPRWGLPACAMTR